MEEEKNEKNEVAPSDLIMQNQINKPLESASYVKSNKLITAKYSSSLLENKVLAVAMARIEINSSTEPDGYTLTASLYPSELKRLFGSNKYLYARASRVADELQKRKIVIEDGKGNFSSIVIVPSCHYKKGELIIKFNNDIKKYLIGLKGGFTELELGITSGFKRNFSLRLYELLKKDAYKINRAREDECCEVEYRVSELKFMTGLASLDSPFMQSVLRKQEATGNIDWDAMYELLRPEERKYDEWREMRRLLIATQQELEDKSDIRFDFDPRREGRKIKKISFNIYHNEIRQKAAVQEKVNIIKESETYRQLEMYEAMFKDLYDDFAGKNGIEKEDLDLIVMKAKENEKIVRAAIEAANKKEYLRNRIGWIIKYIENGGYDDDPTVYGDPEQGKRLNEITEDARKSKNETAKRLWEKTKKGEDYPDFLEAIKEAGINEDMLTFGMTNEERFAMYGNWKTGRDLLYGID